MRARGWHVFGAADVETAISTVAITTAREFWAADNVDARGLAVVGAAVRVTTRVPSSRSLTRRRAISRHRERLAT